MNENNIVIQGLDVTGQTHPIDQVMAIFNRLGGHEPKVSSFKNIGSANKKVLVKFTNPSDPIFLTRNAARLRARGIIVEKDLPPRLREIRHTLLRRRRELIDKKLASTVKVYESSLLVDERDWYDYDRSSNTIQKRHNSRPRPRPPMTGRPGTTTMTKQ